MTVEPDLFIDVTEADLIEFGFDDNYPIGPERFQRVLLSCGHYDRPTFESSSQWDFPADEHICPTCGETRQWDVRAQAAIYEWWREES